jgi:hypothetical protein
MIKRDSIADLVADGGDGKRGDAIVQFEREVASMCSVKPHPNIIQLYCRFVVVCRCLILNN